MKAEGLFGEAVDRIGREPVSSRIARKAPIRHLDPALLLITMLLSAYGAVMVFSATVQSQQAAGLDPNAYVKRQVAYLVVATVALIAVTLFDYRYLRAFAWIAYGVAILGLIVVLSPLGDVQQGAQRWINLGSFQAQPSELAKIAVIMAIAAFLAERKGDVRARDIAVTCAVVLFPGALIYLQPDLGTMLVFLASTAGMLLVAGAKVRHFVALGAVAVLAVVAVFQFGLLKPYQKERITAFLDPHPQYSETSGWNLRQSKIAIGSGGLRGKGLHRKNTQTALNFVPSQHTDFIFTAVGEQLGFVGGAALLGLFAVLMWRTLRIATLSRDLFGTLLAAGIASLWAFQIFVNVGMTLGISPITGIPLPFISYGGSSLLTNYIAVGLLLNIHMRRFL